MAKRLGTSAVKGYISDLFKYLFSELDLVTWDNTSGTVIKCNNDRNKSDSRIWGHKKLVGLLEVCWGTESIRGFVSRGNKDEKRKLLKSYLLLFYILTVANLIVK